MSQVILHCILSTYQPFIFKKVSAIYTQGWVMGREISGNLFPSQ